MTFERIQFCESYLQNEIVVDGISDQALIETAKLHLNGKFPKINYIYNQNKVELINMKSKIQSCILTASNIMLNTITNQPSRSHVDEAMITLLSKEIKQKENVIILQITTLSLSNQGLNQNTSTKDKTMLQNVNGIYK